MMLLQQSNQLKKWAEDAPQEKEEQTGFWVNLLYGAVAVVAAVMLPGAAVSFGLKTMATETPVEIPREEVSRLWGLLGRELNRTK